MNLSTAILMNGMVKPQGFGAGSVRSLDAPCALGGALQSVGIQLGKSVFAYDIIQKLWPWSSERLDCPVCNTPSPAYQVIWHLNDQHRWTRTQIAEWVASFEPQPSPGKEIKSFPPRECRDPQLLPVQRG